MRSSSRFADSTPKRVSLEASASSRRHSCPSGGGFDVCLLSGVKSGRPGALPEIHRQVGSVGAAENKELIRNMFAELSKGNGEAFLGSMADDVRFNLIGTTKYSGTFNGKQELISKLLAPLSAQLEGGISITPENFIADGEYVAMQARGTSKTKDGKSYNNTYCQVFRIVDGKVKELTEYLDTELVTSAFGK